MDLIILFFDILSRSKLPFKPDTGISYISIYFIHTLLYVQLLLSAFFLLRSQSTMMITTGKWTYTKAQDDRFRNR